MGETLTMSDVASIAGVTRQAVTNWRRRLAATNPFPEPVAIVDGVERLDAAEVLAWLEANGRSVNSEAALDAPALAVPRGLTTDNVVPLLCVRAACQDDLATASAAARVERAEAIDPGDAFVLAEARASATDEVTAAYVDALMSASFGGADALNRFEASRASAPRRGLSDVALEMLRALAKVALLHLGEHGAAWLDVEADSWRICDGIGLVHPGTPRPLLQRAVLCGAEIGAAGAPTVRVVAILDADAETTLRRIGEVAADLADGDIAVVLGPASMMCDPMRGTFRSDRQDLLNPRLHGYGGALVAALRLPRGMRRAAVNQRLGLWVLVGGARPSSVVLGDILGAFGAEALADDVAAALARAPGHAYRHGVLTPYAHMWTSDAVVPHGIAPAVDAQPGAGDAQRRAIAASLVTRESLTGFDLAFAPAAGVSSRRPRSIADLLDSGTLRHLRGSRFDAAAYYEGGTVPLVSAGPVSEVGRLDILTATVDYPHAAVAEAGDVVFTATPEPRAFVVPTAGPRVVAPSGILRITAARPGFGPYLLAAAISRASGREWRSWLVPVLPDDEVASLEVALAAAAQHADDLERRVAALDSLTSAVIDGVAAGALTIRPTATPNRRTR